MKGAEFHRNNFSGNHVGGGGEWQCLYNLHLNISVGDAQT